MKKLLGIISFVFLFCNISFADDNPCSFSWTVDKNGFATFTVENKSTSSQVAKISTVIIYAANSEKILTEIFDTPIYVKPFNKKEFKVVNQELMWDLAKSASIGCYPITIGMFEIETNPENKKTKSPGFSDFAKEFTELIVVLGIFGAIIFVYLLFLKQMPTPKKNMKSETRYSLKKRSSNSKYSNRNFIEIVWNGDKSMSKTFWLYCVLISAVVGVIFGTLSASYGFFLFIFPVIYIIWSNVGLWNCSNKYREFKLKKRQTYGWATAAKVYVVLNFITMLSQAGFILRGDF